MQKLKEHEQKLNALTQINHVEAIEDSVKANMPKFVLKAVSDFVQPCLERIVLDVIKKNTIFKTAAYLTHDKHRALYDDLQESMQKKMKRIKGAGGSLSKKALANTSKYKRFEDAHEPKQEQEEVAQHDAFTGEHAHWFKKPYEKRAEELPEQSWFNELVNADKDPGEHKL
ncbi:hypothetical protein Tco_1177746 [Tanacetum coccineum]